MIDPVCPKTGKACRHCSEEKIIQVSRVSVIKTGETEIRREVINLGERCNNDGRHMVRDLPACPVPDAQSVRLAFLELDPLSWMRRRS